jgi:hypothetical protein
VEKTWQDFHTLEEFADYVRGQAHLLMTQAMILENKKALHIAGALCTLSANICNQGTMERERVGENAFDLSALSVDLDQEHPELEEDEDADNPFRGE